MGRYFKRDIARILRKPPRTIEYWTSSGLVFPDIEPSQGKGKARVFSGRNLLEFGMIEIMTRIDISLYTIKAIMDVLREGKFEPDPTDFADFLVDEKSKRKWVEENTVKVRDFWENEDWGVSVEVVYIERKGLSKHQGIPYSTSRWIIFHKDGDHFHIENRLPSWTFDEGPIGTIFYLGKIKLMAIGLILGRE